MLGQSTIGRLKRKRQRAPEAPKSKRQTPVKLQEHNLNRGFISGCRWLRPFGVPLGQRVRFPGLLRSLCWLGAFSLFVSQNLFAQDPDASAQAAFAAEARKAYDQAKARYHSQPDNPDAAWDFARTCFDLAEYATNKPSRADPAEDGIAAARRAVEMKPGSAAAHYYLAMNLAQLARTRTLGALKLLGQMEREFDKARTLDERFDFAGPDRNLGLLYRDAPSLGSIGSRTRAREHLLRAVELEPDYPENRLNLIESYLKWGETSAARRELQALEAAWTKAKTELSGSNWASSWADWQPRLNQVKKRIEGSSKPLQTPRH